MLKKIICSLFIVSLFNVNYAQDAEPYKLFKANGKTTKYKKLLKVCKDVDVVLFGEFHNNSLIHWLELRLTKDLLQTEQLTIGAEMIEADNQAALDDYLEGKIDKKALDTLARLWHNYKTDYKPLVDLAKKENLQFIATNVPRRYAKMVYRNGFEVLDTLPEVEKKWIAKLPIKYDKNLPGYVKMLEMMGGHGGDNFPKAQAIKDATMAYFILKNRKENQLFIHYNGAYHSDNYEGINWYLNQHNDSLKIVTISTVEQDDIKRLKKEHFNKADFIFAVPTDMTKTY